VFPLLAGAAFALPARLKAGRGTRAAVVTVLFVLLGLHGLESTGAALSGQMRGEQTQEKVAGLRAIRGALRPDAVIFTREFLSWHLGAQAHFRVYVLESFTPHYGRRAFPEDQKKPNRWGQSKPRRQEARNARFRAFYDVRGSGDLSRMKLDLMRKYLDQGRQVALVLPSGQAAGERRELGKGTELRELASFQGIWGGSWGVYELRPGKRAP
jgi:hypothetical protein